MFVGDRAKKKTTTELYQNRSGFVGVMAAFEPADAGVQKRCQGCKFIPRGATFYIGMRKYTKGCKKIK